MKALLYIIAILLIAAGIAVGLGSFVAPGQVVIGLNLEAAAILLSGGFVVLGLATVTSALLTVAEVLAGTELPGNLPAAPASAPPPAADKGWPGNYGRRGSSKPRGNDLPGFLRPARGAAASAASGPSLGPAPPPPASPGSLFGDSPRKAEPPPPPVLAQPAEPIDAGVPSDLRATVEAEAASPVGTGYPPRPSLPEESPPVSPPPPPGPAEIPTDDQLFVIEERLIRGKVARICQTAPSRLRRPRAGCASRMSSI